MRGSITGGDFFKLVGAGLVTYIIIKNGGKIVKWCKDIIGDDGPKKKDIKSDSKETDSKESQDSESSDKS